jgi:hypothetical protein
MSHVPRDPAPPGAAGKLASFCMIDAAQLALLDVRGRPWPPGAPETGFACTTGYRRLTTGYRFLAFSMSL